jgi:hypothetical protein
MRRCLMLQLRFGNSTAFFRPQAESDWERENKKHMQANLEKSQLENQVVGRDKC